MKIVFKKGDEYVVAYWVERRKNGIYSFSHPKLWHRELVETCEYFELHYTYPADGNYHVSLKYKLNDIERFEHVYFDRITTKIGYLRNNPLPEVRDVITSHAGFMVPTIKQKPLKSYEAEESMFNFPTMGVNIIDHNSCLMKEHFVTDVVPKQEDIIIDHDALEDCNVSVSCILYSKGIDPFLYATSQMRRSIDSSQVPHIALTALITFMDFS